MLMRDMTYSEATRKAQSLKDVGMTNIYLSGGYPWHLVTDCEPGGSHRMEIATSVRFSAHDPATGLDFNWCFDIEPRSANGSGGYHIDTEGCQRVLAQLPSDAKVSFRNYLADCALKVKDKGDEWMQCATRQLAAAAILRDLATS